MATVTCSPAQAMAVLTLLVNDAEGSPRGEARVTVPEMMRRLGVCRRTVYLALARLRADGLLIETWDPETGGRVRVPVG